MGHRLSKSNWTSSSSSSRDLNQDSTNCNKQSSTISPPPTVQILSITKRTDNVDQRFLTIDQDLQIESASSIAVDQDSTAAPTRFIIRIQLTKMEPGTNNNQLDNNNSTATLATSIDNENRISTNLDNNLNINRPINNFTIPKNIICDAPSTTFTPTTSSSSAALATTATSLRNEQIANDSSNEIKLNNLNQTLDNANSSRHFTNNFTTNRGSSCLNNDENNDSEQDDGNFVKHYAPCNSTSWAAAVRTNNFNDSNNQSNNNNNNNNNVISNSNCNCNEILNISTLPITNQNCNMATMNLSASCKCSTLLRDGQNNVALCYNKFATNSTAGEQHTSSSSGLGANRNDHDRRKKASSPYPPNLGFQLICHTADSSKKSSTISPTSSSSSSLSGDSKESSSASLKASSVQSSNKRSWKTKFNCATRRDSSASGSEQLENNDNSFWSVAAADRPPPPCGQQNCIHTTLIVLVGSMDDGGRQQNTDCLQASSQPGQLTPHIQSAQIKSNLAFTPTEYNPDHIWQLSQRLTVHSQADYIHCLVPDLEKITSSSFYWGKMDRYEAERLLEGKAEGTFLLRDSAQDEYLFSVTFRKYGRSLHARIEQSNHKFSFDCHDPGVFTAPTVTGLLEHYKDPSCVMFFEPMLTIPLHRKFSFSLQQLCRATIVSNINYDGINELQLPNRLKADLKEYHYKYLVRVKPCDTYTPKLPRKKTGFC